MKLYTNIFDPKVIGFEWDGDVRNLTEVIKNLDEDTIEYSGINGIDADEAVDYLATLLDQNKGLYNLLGKTYVTTLIFDDECKTLEFVDLSEDAYHQLKFIQEERRSLSMEIQARREACHG